MSHAFRVTLRKITLTGSVLAIATVTASCSSTGSHQTSAPQRERQEIDFSTSGSDLKHVVEFLDIHTQTPQRPAETGSKSR